MAITTIPNTGLATAGSLVKLSGATTVTNVSSVDLTLSTDYKFFKLIIDQAEPATDGTTLRIRFSVDGGSSFITSGVYPNVTQGVGGSQGDYTSHSNNSDDGDLTAGGIGDQSDEGCAGELNIIPNRSGLSNIKGNYYNFLGYRQDGSDNYRGMLSQGKVDSSGNDIDAVRIYFASGNIQSMTYTLYGVVN